MESRASKSAQHTPVRYLAIDVIRGIAVCGMIAANYPGARAYQLEFLSHAEWSGYSGADFVYPLFLFVAGLSLAARAPALTDKPYWGVIRQSLYRSVRLFLVGLFILSVSYSTPRFHLGTLQCIAITTFLASLCYRWSAAWCFITAIVIGVVYTLVLQFDPTYTIAGNSLCERIDLAILTKFRAEEGVLPTVVLTSMVLFGMGYQKSQQNGDPQGHSSVWYIWALLIAAGLYLFPTNPLFPVLPRIVSPGALMFSMALCVLIYGIARNVGHFSVAKLFGVVGRNALAMFVFAKLFQKWILDGWFISGKTVRVQLVDTFISHLGPYPGSVLFTLTFFTLLLLLAHVLDQRRIYIKL